MPAEAYERLRESVRRYGVRVPLHVTPEGVVLDGHHRLKAAKELKLASVPVQVLDLPEEEQIIWMIRANLDRRQLTAGQRAMLAKLLYEIEKEKAARRRAQAPGKPRGVKQASEVESFPPETGEARAREEAKAEVQGGRREERIVAVGGKAREIAAAQAGVSGRTLEKAMKAIEARPDLAEKLKRGEISVDQAYKLAKAAAEAGKPKPQPQAEEAEVPEPQICVRLPIEAYQQLEALAGDRGLSLAQLVRRILLSYLGHLKQVGEILEV